ncbi:MAG: hypothetical protein JXB47_02590 [Anaerolineae bacterium]|nr:hypothetical protein [Anaerolineae bacterium]
MSDDTSGKIVLYGHPACSMVPPVRDTLERCGADYLYVNIHEDEEARARVREINGGSESVPTLVFPDGSTLTEPPPGALRAKLKAAGYEAPARAWLYDNAYLIVVTVVAVLIVLRLLGVI